jgi:hypothetical protein|tara:strand:- start:810 stop:989 length:180 start_codon:yes stop_codon:yes gene_type:complete
MSGLTLFFLLLAGFSLVLYSMTVPMPFGSGTEDDFAHTLSLYGFAFFGGLAYLSYKEDQ